MSVLKNKTLQVKMVQETPGQPGQVRPPTWTPESVTKVFQDQVMYLAIVGGGLYVLKKVVDTTGEVITIKASQKKRVL